MINSFGEPITHLWTFDAVNPMCREVGVYELNCNIPKLRLYLGEYSLKIYFTGPAGGETYEVLENICPFEVVILDQVRDHAFRPGTCTYIEDFDWKIKHLQ